MMGDRTTRRGVSLIFMLTVIAPFTGAAAQQAPQYSYANDWSVVSAPPPAGPYRSIHVDPRVPGQDISPPVTAAAMPDILPAPLAAAGEQPVPQPAPVARSPATGSPAMQPPVPGRYGRVIPPPTAFNYPTPPWRYGVPGYTNMPPFGYYRIPAYRPEVPPLTGYRTPPPGYGGAGRWVP
jgi:hypothetical protein